MKPGHARMLVGSLIAIFAVVLAVIPLLCVIQGAIEISGEKALPDSSWTRTTATVLNKNCTDADWDGYSIGQVKVEFNDGTSTVQATCCDSHQCVGNPEYYCTTFLKRFNVSDVIDIWYDPSSTSSIVCYDDPWIRDTWIWWVGFGCTALCVLVLITVLVARCGPYTNISAFLSTPEGKKYETVSDAV